MAVVYQWNSGSGLFSTAANWLDVTNGDTVSALVPGTQDTAEIDVAVATTISGDGSVADLELTAAAGALAIAGALTTSVLGFDGGEISVGGVGASISAADAFGFGLTANASLDIASGGSVAVTGTAADSFDNIQIGVSAGMSGLVTVDGTGAMLNAGAGALGVGLDGDGLLSVLQGGTVLASAANYSTIQYGFYVGWQLGTAAIGSGVVTVDGTGSLLGVTDQVAIGVEETGVLVVSDGGTFSESGTLPNNYSNIMIGVDTSGTGDVTVTTGGVFDAGEGALAVGMAGVGTLAVEDGGTVLASDAGYTTVEPAVVLGWTFSSNTLATGTGVVTVDGTGSIIKAAGGIYVGDYGSGSLTVSDAGTVQATATEPNDFPNVVVGFTTGSTGDVTVSTGGVLDAGPASIAVGLAGDGTLAVVAGGTVLASGTSYSDVEPALNLGWNLASNSADVGTGVVTVDGSGSLVKADGEVDVGDYGSGSLTISDSGTVEVTATEPNTYPNVRIGVQAAAAGNVTVMSGGVLDAGAGSVAVGEAGAGTLFVGTDGTVLAANTGYTDVEAALRIGVSLASNTLVTGSGVVTVSGAGALINTDGAIYVGDHGTGNLSVSFDGLVEVTGTEPNTDANIDIGNHAGASGTATVSGAELDAGTGRVTVGNAGSGTLIVSDGGTVRASAAQYTDTEQAVRIGLTAGGVGVVTIDGAGSTLAVDGGMWVGDNGSATLSVAAGASVSVGGTNDGGTGLAIDAGSGSGDVAVGGSTLSVSDGALIGGAGVLVVGDSGVVTIAGSLSLDSGALVSVDASSAIAVGGAAEATGAVAIGAGGGMAGAGVVQAFVTDAGTVTAAGGTLEITYEVFGAGTLAIADGATLKLDAADAGTDIAFGSSGGSTLDLAGVNLGGALLSGFVPSDAIVVGDAVGASATTSSAGGITTMTLNAGSTFLGTLEFTGTPTLMFNAATGIITACFAAGTRIATARGEVMVEDLRVGDHVALARRPGGSRPVIWLGHREVDCARHPRPHDVWPVHVHAGAFGRARPKRDLWLSPDHAVLVDGVLIPIRYLINGATIVQEPRARVAYWHVELDRHDAILAEALPCESYLDTGNRAAFSNGGGAVHLHPAFALRTWEAKGFAPLVLDGPALHAARRRLLGRARQLGHVLTHDAALHLLPDGRAVRPAGIDGVRYRFALASRANELRIRSNSGIPAQVDAVSGDHRRLGVMVARIAVLRPWRWQEIALADLGEGGGWHALEEGDGRRWRWTDGDARLPIPDDCAREGILMVEIDVAATQPTWRAAISRSAASPARLRA